MMHLEEHNTRYRLLALVLIAVMFCTAALPLQAEGATALAAPGKVTLKSVTQNGSTLTVKWYQVTGCSGYQIQYSTDRYFLGKVTKKVKKAKTTSKKIRWLDEGTRYYVRIRAYRTKKKTTAYSAWTTYNNIPSNILVRKQRVRTNILKKFELRSAAKQAIPGYDSMQGACYGKGYAYFILNNRNTGKCKIAKVRLRNMKVVKVSGVLNVHHGNDMTYNTKTNRLVVANSTGATKTVSVVNPSTLKIQYNATVELPESLPGLKKSKRKYYNGFGAIAYNSKYNQYVVLLRGANFHHLMFLDSNFNPVRFAYLDVRVDQTAQGMDSIGDSILVGQSYGGGKPNSILVYDWEGNYKSMLTLGKKYEFETVFHSNNAFYLGYYTSYYKKKGKGSALQRDGYLFKVTNL